MGNTAPQMHDFDALLARATQARAAHAFAETVRLCDELLVLTPRAKRPRVHLLRLDAIDRGALAETDTREKDALAATGSPSDAIDVRLLLGRIAMRRADLPRAVQLATTMRALLKPEDARRRAKALCLEAMAKWSLGTLAEATQLQTQAATLGREAGDALSEAAALNDRGLVRGYTGDFAGALADHEAALLLVRTSRDPDAGYLAGQVQNDLGFALCNLGHHNDAQTALTLALEHRRTEHDIYGEAITLNNLGNVHRAVGRHVEALAHYEDAVAKARRSKNVVYEAIALNNLGLLSIDANDLERAQQLLEDALALTERIGDRIREADNRGSLGALFLRRADPSRALPLLERAVQMRRQLGDVAYLIVDGAALAVALARSGENGDARDMLAEVDDLLAKGQKGIEQEQWVHLCAHWTYTELGETTAARAALERAVAQMELTERSIDDPDARRAYGERLAVNRDIRAALAAMPA